MADGEELREQALSFGPEDALVGVWTEPRGAASRDAGRPAVLMLNSGVVHHVGIWRLHVRLARALARRGFSSLRFDLSGIGDSNIAQPASNLSEMVARDVDAAIDHVREARGVPSVALLGLCSGAHDAIEAAVRRRDVTGVIAIDLIADLQNWQHRVAHVRKRVFNAESWRNALPLTGFGAAEPLLETAEETEAPGPTLGVRDTVPRGELATSLERLLGRDVGLLFVFSAGLEENYNHAGQFAEVLPEVAAHPAATNHFFPDADHTFSDTAQQAALIRLIVDWLSGRCPETAAREGRAVG